MRGRPLRFLRSLSDSRRLAGCSVLLCCTLAGCVTHNEQYCGHGYPCAEGLRCDPALHRCVPRDGGFPPEDGGPADRPPPVGDACVDDAPELECTGGSCANPQPNGAPCGTNPEACQSNHCVDGVCCAAAGCPPCQACNLNGRGSCSPLPDGTRCGATTCAAGAKSVPACQGGSCQLATQSCSGYRCDDAGTDCRSACAVHEHCASTHFCDSSKQCTPKLPLGTACALPLECASGLCTDGVCCGVPSCGDCQVCQAQTGTCGARPDGPAPPGKCPGDALCGAGTCKGGACDYLPASTPCARSCSGQTEEIRTCDAAHACVTSSTNDCSPYVCRSDGTACRTQCVLHSDCVAASACDRSVLQPGSSTAHPCVDPSSPSVIEHNIGDPNPRIAHGATILLVGSTYPYALSISSPLTVKIIGKNKPIIDAPTSAPAVLVAAASAKLTLQDVQLKGSSYGLRCTAGEVLILDSTIEDNELYGVYSDGCLVSLVRNKIGGNYIGGVELRRWNGTPLLAGNLVTNNGSCPNPSVQASCAGRGGILLDNSGYSTDGALLVNNTVAQNIGGFDVAAGGMICGSPATVRNAIAIANQTRFPSPGPPQLPYLGPADITGSCSFSFSTIGSTTPAGTGNNSVDCFLDTTTFKQAPSSVCVDSGSDPGVNDLDLDLGPRIEGPAVDRGAYEVK